MMMKRFIVPFLAALSLLAVLLNGTVQAATYKFIDKQGSISFADDLQVIPEEYRAGAVLIEGELKAEDEKEAAPAEAAASRGPVVPEPAVSQHQPVSAPSDTLLPAFSSSGQEHGSRPLFGEPVYTRIMITGGVVLVWMIALILLRNIPVIREKANARVLLRSSMVAVLLIYLGIAHARDVILVFTAAGNKIEAAQQRSAERGRKAAEVMKKMEALSGQVQQMQKEEEEQMKELEKGQ